MTESKYGADNPVRALAMISEDCRAEAPTQGSTKYRAGGSCDETGPGGPLVSSPWDY
jgi:hypothetical protein